MTKLALVPYQAPAFAASGLAGSTAASRYVGATASGAPTTGAHLVGDFVIAQNGHLWICTAAGTPGTWVDAGGSGGAVSSVAGRTGAVTLTAADIGSGTFPGAYSVAGLVTASAGIAVPSGQPLTTGTRSIVTGTRAVTTSASDTVDLGVFSTTGGALELRIHAHLAAPGAGTTASVTKVYEFAVSATTGSVGNGTFTDAASGGGGYKLLPADASANQATSNDFALEVRRSAAGTFIFRFRQISIGVAGSITFTVETLGDTTATFTPSTTITSAPTAVASIHPSNPLVLAAGNVGIGTDAPASMLHLSGGPAGQLGSPFITMQWPAAGTMKVGVGAGSMTDVSPGSDGEMSISSGWLRFGVAGGLSTLRVSSSDVQINNGGLAQSMPRGRIQSVGPFLTTTGSITTTELVYGSINDVSFTVVTGRRYRISWMLPVQSTVAADQISVKLRDGGGSAPTNASTVIDAAFPIATGANRAERCVSVFEAVGVASGAVFGQLNAGTHRVGLYGLRSAGTGTIQLGSATAGLAAYLMVEDMGA